MALSRPGGKIPGTMPSSRALGRVCAVTIVAKHRQTPVSKPISDRVIRRALIIFFVAMVLSSFLVLKI
jgi:hypothetical protein